MADVATRKMTFDEFIALPEEDIAYELVDGRLVPLMAPRMKHSGAQAILTHYIQDYLGDDFEGFLGDELDFPTIPYHGRRGDIVYLTPEHVTEEDWERGYPAHAPDLVIEVLSQDAERRDVGDKRVEYAQVGVANYWVVDPRTRTVEMLALDEERRYSIRQFLTAGDTLTTPLFPGLAIPLRRVFRERRSPAA